MDVDELYDAPLEQFVARRGELARELRKQGEREQAAEIAALRKPSVAAWAVNQLVRTQPRSVAELLDAGDALQEAHRTATSGRGDAAALRAAAQRERSAVDDLVQAARGLLTGDGHELSPTIINRVADTLRAAALDDEAREQVRDGRLERELRHVGLGVLAGEGAVQAPAALAKRKAKPKPKSKSKESPAGQDAEQRAEDERRKRERDQALKAAREVETKARRQAERADRALKMAQRLRDRAAEDLETAEQSLAEARADADEAKADLERAQEELDSL
ncbi:MAG TPA: hypothetical protein VLK59_00615 [Solirubrobacteraceae bacterium]|nr:hypothetical protein [Solirubrobacteraceae bacterium]